ncbi:hypothetical protein A1353_22040 [Methylomonas methanica]|uniref:Cytochrome c peroxidase n=1 Tax=Methylomonas methanica TaxID=421 RepID=A0A177LXK1_METMH|nr:hypothetical protein A1353_22040 [Methylomonas methanica]
MGVNRKYFIQRGSEQTAVDNGRFNVTHQEVDRYIFKVLVPRNIELTYPYFHDGSVLSLADAVRFMGEVQLDKTFTHEETAKMVAYLGALTGEIKGKSLAHLTAADIQ